MITVVIGSFGVGKTHWIQQQFKENQDHHFYYYSPKTNTFPLDGAFLQSIHQDLSIVDVQSPQDLIELAGKNHIYLEVPEYVDYYPIKDLFEKLNAQVIAIVNPEENQDKWKPLTNNIIVNQAITIKPRLPHFSDLQIHRATLTGEVLDFSSLETFWQELTLGAYGDIFRAKGIFNIMDGQCIYGEYLDHSYSPEFYPLNLPLSLEGRPTHFSGLEIIGCNLDKKAMADTLGDFCLDDSTVYFYQQQVRESLKNDTAY
ncbi:MAG: GTP-binding protein [Cyanobacterium sp.]